MASLLCRVRCGRRSPGSCPGDVCEGVCVSVCVCLCVCVSVWERPLSGFAEGGERILTCKEAGKDHIKELAFNLWSYSYKYISHLYLYMFHIYIFIYFTLYLYMFHMYIFMYFTRPHSSWHEGTTTTHLKCSRAERTSLASGSQRLLLILKCSNYWIKCSY